VEGPFSWVRELAEPESDGKSIYFSDQLHHAEETREPDLSSRRGIKQRTILISDVSSDLLGRTL
jgi:hypothetical protein